MPRVARSHSIPIDSAHGIDRILLEIAVPELPGTTTRVRFAEHALDGKGQPTDTVVACTRGGVVVSEDLGITWDFVPIRELSEVELCNSFTTANGMHLVQGRGAAALGIPRTSDDLDAPIAILDQDWTFLDRISPGVANWHGSRSIDEANDVIVFGEYPANSQKYVADFDLARPTAEQLDLLHDSQLFRSTDGGHSWDSVLRVDWRGIRHFHTVAADPWQPGRWWASSGDRPEECRVWQSLDHGVNWREVDSLFQVDELPPTIEDASRVLRYTDLVVRERDLIWGVDDSLGPKSTMDAEVPLSRRGGARIFRSSKNLPWEPKSIGYVGNPVRSMIDVGPAYLVMTEAKGLFGFRPEILLLSKAEPFELTRLMTVDNFGAAPATGFTHSRASRAAKDGVFFTYRSATDVFPDGANILRWRIAIE